MHIQIYEMYLCVFDLQVTSAQSETVQNVAALLQTRIAWACDSTRELTKTKHGVVCVTHLFVITCTVVVFVYLKHLCVTR